MEPERKNENQRRNERRGNKKRERGKKEKMRKKKPVQDARGLVPLHKKAEEPLERKRRRGRGKIFCHKIF